MKLAKRELLGSIHSNLVSIYGHEFGGQMFLYMVQKCQGMNYGDANKMLKQDFTFLQNLSKDGVKKMENIYETH